MPALFLFGQGGCESRSVRFQSDPVVQRQRLLAYNQKTMVRVHPGSFQLLIYDCRFRIESQINVNNRKLHGSVGNWQTTLFQTQRCCGFESHSSYLSTRPRGAVRSARHPVKVEIRGSNPLGDAFLQDQTNSFALAEHWRAQVAVTHPPSGFGGSTPSRRIHKQYGRVVESGRHATLKMSSRKAWEFESPLGHCR